MISSSIFKVTSYTLQQNVAESWNRPLKTLTSGKLHLISCTWMCLYSHSHYNPCIVVYGSQKQESCAIIWVAKKNNNVKHMAYYCLVLSADQFTWLYFQLGCFQCSNTLLEAGLHRKQSPVTYLFIFLLQIILCNPSSLLFVRSLRWVLYEF